VDLVEDPSAVTAYCLLLTAYCLLLTAYCLLLTAYCLPLTAYRLLLTAYCLLLTAYRLLLTAYCLPLTAYRLKKTGRFRLGKRPVGLSAGCGLAQIAWVRDLLGLWFAFEDLWNFLLACRWCCWSNL
jgi:hypothetical protein